MAKMEYEIDDSSDQDDSQDDGEGFETTLESRAKGVNKPSKDQSDAELFDDLPNGIKFPAAKEEADEGDDEDEEDTRGNRAETDDEDERDDADEDDDRPARGEDKTKFQKRLMRERRLRQEAEEDARTSDDNYKRLEGKLDQLLNAQTTSKTTAELDRKIAEAGRKLEEVRTALAAAHEAGETKDVIKLTEQLSDLKSDIKQAEADKVRAAEAAEAATKAAATAAASRPQNRHLTRWMRQHGTTYRGDTMFKAAAEAADKQLAANGSNPNSEEHFDKLNQILAKRFPEEFPNLKRGKKDVNRRRPPVGGESEEPTQARRPATGDIQIKGNKARLTGRHLKIMRDFGLDPDSPADVQSFVRENRTRKNR